MIRCLLLCLCLLVAALPARALDGVPPELATWRKAAQHFDRVFFGGEPAIEKRRADFEAQFKSDRVPQWVFSEWAEAYATMYETTGDIKYAAALAELIEIAFTYRDDRAGRVDGLTGKKLPAWGMFDAYFKLRTVRVGTSALVLSPAARLLGFMREKPELAALAGMDAAELEKEILRTVQVFDSVLEDVSGGGSRYLIPASTGDVSCAEAGGEILEQWSVSAEEKCETQKNLAGRAEAFNIQLKMALALQYLGEAAGNREASQRVDALTRYFLKSSGLRRLPDGRAYAYNYAEGGRIEDVSHANLVGEFLAVSYLDGLQDGKPLVEREIPAGIAAAIVDYAAVLAEDPNDGNRLKQVLTPYIDGSRAGNLSAEGNDDRLFGQRTSRVRRSCKQMLLLAVFDIRVAQLCGSIMSERANLSPMGLAYMAKALKLIERYGGEVP
ncbi:MAG: hypothetical protein ACKVP5_06045 [Aestuariivirga sp.]